MVPAAVPPEGSAAPEEAGDAEASLGFELDLDEPAETISRQPEAEVGPEPEASAESIKLLIESDVLLRYGMHEMAAPVLERILHAEPRHAEALARLVRARLQLGQEEDALEVANRLAEVVEEGDPPQSWEEVRASMVEHGFEISNGRFAAGSEMPPPAAKESEEPEPEEQMPEEPAPAEPDPVVELVEELEAEPPAAVAEHSLEEIVAEAAAEVAPRARRHPEPTGDVLGEVMDELAREAGEAPAAAEPEAPPLAQPSQPEPPTESVQDLPAEPTSDDFVDLATELEAELLEEDGLEDDLLPNMREQSLEDIVEGFRQGMAETLSDSDFDTHYNLGVAYQEMGLIDEAIGEFQLAAKDDRYLVDCSSLLASCFLGKDLPDLAIQWFVRGIESPAIDPESRLGLLYELASLLAATGERDAARERFLEIYGVNSNYRDVATKLEELPA